MRGNGNERIKLVADFVRQHLETTAPREGAYQVRIGRAGCDLLSGAPGYPGAPLTLYILLDRLLFS